MKVLRLQTHVLQQKLTVRVANGEGLDVTRFVEVRARLGTMPISLQLRVINTSIPVVLGYTFLTKFQPHIDWKKRFVRIWRKGKIYEISALPAADSFRMSTTGVLEAEWDMLQAHGTVTGKAVEQSGEGHQEMSRRGSSVEGNSVDASEEFKKECELTPRERQAISRSQEPKWKTKRKLKNSPRKAVEQLFKEVDHNMWCTLCEGPYSSGD